MLEIVPMTLREANAFVEQNHRHHGATVGHKFSIGLSDGEKIVGVAIVGRPVSRHLDDGWTLEVNRLCTDGTRNACSMLYAAAWRAARAMGYSIYYGAITMIPEEGKTFVTVEGDRVPQTWVERRPDRRFLQVNSKPLTVPHEVNSWYVAKVL